MKILLEFLGQALLHLCPVMALYFCVGTLWGNLAQQSYQSRMRLPGLLMPGRLADEQYWVKRQRIFAMVFLPFAVVGSILSLVLFVLKLL